jgi:hypothetical protein
VRVVDAASKHVVQRVTTLLDQLGEDPAGNGLRGVSTLPLIIHQDL